MLIRERLAAVFKGTKRRDAGRSILQSLDVTCDVEVDTMLQYVDTALGVTVTF